MARGGSRLPGLRPTSQRLAVFSPGDHLCHLQPPAKDEQAGKPSCWAAGRARTRQRQQSLLQPPASCSAVQQSDPELRDPRSLHFCIAKAPANRLARPLDVPLTQEEQRLASASPTLSSHSSTLEGGARGGHQQRHTRAISHLFTKAPNQTYFGFHLHECRRCLRYPPK